MFDDAMRDALLPRLDRLRLTPPRPLPGPMRGDLRSVRQGASLEFIDYREYRPGDDERHIDWHVAARTGEYVVRLYEDEENLRVELLIDQSASMGFGTPEKLTYAAAVASAVGYVALRNGHEVHTLGFAERLKAYGPPLRGVRGVSLLFTALDSLTAGGETSLLTSLKERSTAEPRPCVTLIFSDLYDDLTWRSGLDRLLAQGRQVYLLHVLSPEEITPQAEGAVEWVDAETGKRLEVTVDGDTLTLYREAFDAWVAEIRSYCAARAVRYIPVSSATPLEQLLFVTLRKEGILR